MHVHVNAITGVYVFLMVVIGLGVANLLAMKFAGHPAADAWRPIADGNCPMTAAK